MMCIFTKGMNLFLVVFLLLKISGEAEAGRKKTISWLHKYGYLPVFNDDPSAKVMRASIINLQYYAGLKLTGKPDEATIKQMEEDRCGMRDPEVKLPDNLRIRTRRYTLEGNKWDFSANPNRRLTWRLANVGRGLTRTTVRIVLTKAFKMWSKYGDINFREIGRSSGGGEADILVSFVTSCHYSADYYCFDGAGGTLAHAFYPKQGAAISGDVHFDDDETFTYKKNTGTDLLWVAVHEIGHSLGLEHSNVRGAIMFPWYQKHKGDFDLHPDDVSGIKALYGAAVVKPPPTLAPPLPVTYPQPPIPKTTLAPPPPPTTTKAPPPPTTKAPPPPATTEAPPLPVKTKAPRKKFGQRCPKRIDAAVIEPKKRNYMYIFSNEDNKNHFYVATKDGLRYGPIKTENYFPRITGKVTGAYVRKSDKKMILFTGKSYYVYNNFYQESGPNPISDFKLPSFVNTVDAVFSWKRNSDRKIYLFYRYWYFRYDFKTNKIDSGYPRYITSGWKGIPYSLSEALTDFSDSTYFIKKNKIYLLDDKYVQLKSGYPKYLDTWLRCDDPEINTRESAETFSDDEVLPEPTGDERDEP